MDNKEKILNLISTIKREGIENLIRFLNESDFFTAPCSLMFHLAEEGGLAEHSLNVYNLLAEKVKRYNVSATDDTVKICGLCHDLCKVNFYTKGKKWAKENGRWVEKEVYLVKDHLPLGHGEKSVIMLQDFIKLTDDEKLAIRWHMLAFDAGIHFNYPSGYAFREASKNPLVVLLFTSDYEASQIIEEKKEK